MPCCVVPTCKNATGHQTKQEGITFHVFPADAQRKSDWANIIQRARLDELWKPSKRSVVCSIHFDEKYFYPTKAGLKRLKKDAIPNKNVVVKLEDPESCRSAGSSTPKHEPQASTSQNQEERRKRNRVKKENPATSSENEQLPKRMSQRTSLAPSPNYRETQGIKRPKLDSTAFTVEVPLVEPPKPPPAGPRISVRSLRELSSRLDSYMSQPEDENEAFGRHIASLLRRLPEHKAFELRSKIVHMVTTAVLEEAPPEDEEPEFEVPVDEIPEPEQPDVADPLARPEPEDIKPDVETIVFQVPN